MHHHVAHTAGRALLFTSVDEACALWHRLVRAAPGLHALCLMPDHVHVVTPRADRRWLARALSGYTRWRNARLGIEGPCLRPSPPVEAVGDGLKRRRTLRYVHLNPCRGGLVDAPLAWPFSTHLDAVGLVPWPARPPVPDPRGFHRYVSSDPHARVDGTGLPVVPAGDVPIDRLLAAVSVATRTPADDLLTRRSPARTLLLGLARGTAAASTADLADALGVSPRTVRRASPVSDPRLLALAGDPRVIPLHDAILERWLDRWRRRAA